MPPSKRIVDWSTSASSSASRVHFGARTPEEEKKTSRQTSYRQGVRARALACAEAAALAAFLAALLGEQNVAASYATRRRTTRCSAAGSGVGASAQGWASRPLTHLIARGARVLWIDWYDKTLRFDESDAWRS